MRQLFTAIGIVGLALTARAASGATAVDVQIILAVDVSRSMDSDEQRLQRDGYVDAFRDPNVIQAIASGPLGQVAVTYFEWSGPDFQLVTMPWTMIHSAADANAFADK